MVEVIFECKRRLYSVNINSLVRAGHNEHTTDGEACLFIGPHAAVSLLKIIAFCVCAICRVSDVTDFRVNSFAAVSPAKSR